ncbi:MAG: transcriptional regulator PpsR, partial [Betaproteobacteria bacterium]|nr:transcriptional regulator PpsR [Betaproteobacteria bacterium]
TLSDPQANWMLYVHDIHRLRQTNTPAKAAGMADSVAQLAQLVGRMPMKDIVGETNEMIERMCILAALDLTRNNRASAAEMLGLSRQSLYVKLRRFGLATDKDH